MANYDPIKNRNITSRLRYKISQDRNSSEIKTYNPNQNQRITEENQQELDDYVPIEDDTGNIYPGPYEITPTENTKILNTRDLELNANVIVNPIPTNYGKITWNGSTLTVS